MIGEIWIIRDVKIYENIFDFLFNGRKLRLLNNDNFKNIVLTPKVP